MVMILPGEHCVRVKNKVLLKDKRWSKPWSVGTVERGE